jgi:hypothetical protein
MDKFVKAFVAVAGTVATWFATKDPEQTGAAAMAALGVFLIPNTVAFDYAKSWVSALVLGAGVFLPALDDGFTTADLWPTIVVVATALGVLVLPNAKPKPESRTIAGKWDTAT